MLNQKLWPIAFRRTILANKSSSICLMLFHMQIYMNFMNAIENNKIRPYINKKVATKNSRWGRTRGTSSFPSNTLTVFKPQTMVPYTPPYIYEDKGFKIYIIGSTFTSVCPCQCLYFVSVLHFVIFHVRIFRCFIRPL